MRCGGNLTMPAEHQDKPSHKAHKAAAPRSVPCMVITCSDTRTPENDTSGALIMSSLKGRGHTVVSYHLVKDDPSVIRKLIRSEERRVGKECRL